MLPRRIPKAPKRSTRWRSQAHCNFVRSHACCACGSMAAIEVAHVRRGSHAGISQKPDDWNTISLCHECHRRQHQMGEESFEKFARINMRHLADAFAAASPKAYAIREAKRSQSLTELQRLGQEFDAHG